MSKQLARNLRGSFNDDNRTPSPDNTMVLASLSIRSLGISRRIKKIAKESQCTKDYARAHPIKILFNPANLSHPPPAESPSLYFTSGAALSLEPFFFNCCPPFIGNALQKLIYSKKIIGGERCFLLALYQLFEGQGGPLKK